MRKRLVILIIAIVAAGMLIGVASDTNVQPVYAQSIVKGYSQRPWLSQGWHRADDLQSIGVTSGPNDWLDYYGAKFAFVGCGFSISYGVVVGGSGQVQVYIDGQIADDFNVSSATEKYQSRWYIAPTCGVHVATFGTNTIRSIWLIGVEVIGSAP